MLIGLKISSFAQACDDCSHPRVALYDSNINIPRPSEDPQSIIAWQTLFWPSAAARSYIRADDPTGNCIVWMDGAMINAIDLQDGKLKFGPEYSNLPATGPLNLADYLISSKMQPIGTIYLFTLVLETAESREVVKTVELVFSANVESANNAGKQAAMSAEVNFKFQLFFSSGGKRNVESPYFEFYVNNTEEGHVMNPNYKYYSDSEYGPAHVRNFSPAMSLC